MARRNPEKEVKDAGLEPGAPVHCANTGIAGIDTLQPNPRNPNRHPKAQVELLAKIIKHQGWRNPVVVSARSGFVVKGHARIEAARLLGATGVPVDLQKYESEAEEWADMVADNKIAELAHSDMDEIQKMALEIGEGFDFELFGIPDFVISNLTGVPMEELDRIPDEAEVESVCEPGDFWHLGNHLLFCGDSTDSAIVKELLEGRTHWANLVMTSPPYWIGKEYEVEKREDEIDGFIQKSCAVMVEACKNDLSRIVINSGVSFGTAIGEKHPRIVLLIDKWINNMAKLGWLLKSLRFWVKPGWTGAPHPPSHDFVIQGTEFLMSFYNPKGEQRGQNRLPDVPWTMQCNFDDIAGDRGENSAGYPVELPSRFIRLYTLEKEIVFEPFCGNGTTIIACESLNRSCIAVEKLPRSCDVTIKRWETLTGKQAELVYRKGKMIERSVSEV